MHPSIAPRRRPFRPHFMHLFRLVLARSRWPELAKANHFLAHLALLVGPEALFRPATAQKSLGRGRSPPCAPPMRRCAAPWLGYAQPKTPKRGDLAASPHMGGGGGFHRVLVRADHFLYPTAAGNAAPRRPQTAPATQWHSLAAGLWNALSGGGAGGRVLPLRAARLKNAAHAIACKHIRSAGGASK
jgi:hypothetical protein